MTNRVFLIISLLFAVFVVGAALILLSSLNPYKEAVKLSVLGDSFLEYGSPEAALKSYKQAEDKWLLYKIDPRFQQQKKKAEAELKKKVAVTIFLKDEVKDSDIQGLIQEIKTIQGAREVKFISKEEALKTYQERNKNEPILIELAPTLPAAIEVFLDDLGAKDEVANLGKGKTFVDEVIQFP